MADLYEDFLTGLQSDNPQKQAHAVRLLQGVNTPLSAAAWSRLKAALIHRRVLEDECDCAQPVA